MDKSSDKQKPPTLRPATNADAEEITELVFGVLAEYDLKPHPTGTDSDLNDIEQSYFGRGGEFYVLEAHDGSIAGSVGLYRTDDTSCELRKMYVQKEYRSRGLGRLLMEHALVRARELGFETITLETADVLKEAISLYKSYGFKEYTPQHMAPRCTQAYILEF